ncbi:GNAT family N-acetyltransferase [Aquibium sp. LZ166]|uniref:GNAT family N-acetyltransferase n=1 Tax=Aquibium pacificus TaxID=3153579 RepID=A0ABV3SH25_9HYPH
MRALRTQRLILRNWEDRDRELFFRINSDDAVMTFFPFRRSRQEADDFMERLRARIAAQGYGFTALELAATGQAIGFAGLNPAGLEPVLPADTIEIGWRLAPEFWGKGLVTEAGEALLAFGFEELDLDEVVSFAVWNNDRSTAVMRRLGMRPDAARDFDHPKVPDTHPHLKRHIFYGLTRSAWRERKKAAR